MDKRHIERCRQLGQYVGTVAIDAEGEFGVGLASSTVVQAAAFTTTSAGRDDLIVALTWSGSAISHAAFVARMVGTLRAWHKSANSWPSWPLAPRINNLKTVPPDKRLASGKRHCKACGGEANDQPAQGYNRGLVLPEADRWSAAATRFEARIVPADALFRFPGIGPVDLVVRDCVRLEGDEAMWAKPCGMKSFRCHPPSYGWPAPSSGGDRGECRWLRQKSISQHTHQLSCSTAGR